MACVRSGSYYSHLAAARFDPSERMAKKIRILKAAQDIRTGARLPEQAGVPGIGLKPVGSYRWDWWVQDPVADQTSLHRNSQLIK
jgi:hypothetical protein